jgi:hypothetical protein
MKRLLMIALIICVLGCVGAMCGSLRSSVRVEYEITGTASTVSVTLNNATGGTEHFSNVSVPHTFTFENYRDWFFSVSAQNDGASGSVTVTIYIDGEVVATSTSSGAYVIASADHSRL